TRLNLATGGEARYAEGLWVTGEFFTGLGVAPLMGRVFTAQDDKPGCALSGAVIGYAFWQREFGAAADVLGRKLTLNGRPVEVIGVAPASFYGVEVGKSFDVALPACAEPIVDGENSHLGKRAHWWLAIMGRLKPVWSLARAQAQLDTISASVFQNTVPPNFTAEGAKWYVTYKLTAVASGTGVSSLRKRYEDPLLMLLAIAALVLLIA